MKRIHRPIRRSIHRLVARSLITGVLLAGPGIGWGQETSMSRQGETIPGYTYGSDQLTRSPVSLEDFELLRKTVLFSEEDARYLRMSAELLGSQADAILDVWYGFVGANPHLLAYFSGGKDGKPDANYLAAVRLRFKQWILDTARADYDQKWLDYQYEIARRHHRVGKNRTDGAEAVSHIHFRYLPALVYPVTATLRPFLEKGGHSVEEVEKMQQAWIKSVLLQVILWSHPYVNDGDF